jgi:glycosyltransferase involved in cell wall biosynthesis
MDVSVVIPSYNSKKFLKQTLESANKQEFEGKFEILVIDDCSTDGSFEFAQSLAEKYSNIKVYQTPTNGGGPAWARNLGVKKANGKYVSFLDADDLWHPNKIQKQFELAEKSGCQFISTKKYIFPENSIFSLH